MKTHRSDPAAFGRLVEPDRVPRDLYLSEEPFELEQERLFARARILVGRVSQVARPGWSCRTDGTALTVPAPARDEGIRARSAP